MPCLIKMLCNCALSPLCGNQYHVHRTQNVCTLYLMEVLRCRHFSVSSKQLFVVLYALQSSTVLVSAVKVTFQLSHTSLHLANSHSIMMLGAACEDGTFCDTGRADATGGYCTPIAQAAGMTPTSAPALAPSGESIPEASAQANQECSATGMSRSQGRLSDCCLLACLMARLLDFR